MATAEWADYVFSWLRHQHARIDVRLQPTSLGRTEAAVPLHRWEDMKCCWSSTTAADTHYAQWARRWYTSPTHVGQNLASALMSRWLRHHRPTYPKWTDEGHWMWTVLLAVALRQRQMLVYLNNGSGHHQPRLEFFALCTKSQPYLQLAS